MGLAISSTGGAKSETREEEIKLPADPESIRTDKESGLLVTFNITSTKNCVCE